MNNYKSDAVIIFFVLLFAFAAYFSYPYFINEGANSDEIVQITVNGKEYGNYSLLNDLKIPVKTDFGFNLIEINDGKAYISEADCPDKLCVNKGKVCENGQQIVCLPNRVVIRIFKSESKGEYDAVAY